MKEADLFNKLRRDHVIKQLKKQAEKFNPGKNIKKNFNKNNASA